MTQQLINTGTVINDGTGDTLKTAGIKINTNFTELYSSIFTLPPQTNNTGKALITDGTKASWQPIAVLDGVLTTGSYADPSWLTSLDYSKITNAPAGYTLPISTTTVLGGVKVDGTTITINAGVISSTAGGATNFTVTTNSPGNEALSYNSGTFTFTPYLLTNTKIATALGYTPIQASSISVTTAAASGTGSLTYNNGTGVFTFTPAVTITSVTGNAGTATALQTARTINGVSFDGTSNIVVGAAAGTLSGNTLNSTVLNSNLTTIGTLSSLSVTGNATITGNLTVTGTTTTTSTSTLTVTNKTIIVSSGSTSSAISDGSGLVVNGPVIPASILYTAASNSFTSNVPIVASSFTGNLIGNVTGNVTGNVSGNAGTVTTITSNQVTGALGFTPIQTTNLSVGTAAASGSGSLTYNNGTGAFTFTPPVIPSVPTYTITTAAASSNGSLSLNGSTFTFTPADLSGYLTGITGSQVTTALGFTPIQLSSLSVTTNTASGNGSLSYSAGVFSFTPPSLSGYLTGITGSQVTTALGFTPIQTTSLSVTTGGASGNGSLSYTGGVFTFNPPNLSAYLTGITSGQITTALGFTPYSNSNPNNYITGITSSNVTTALGFTPIQASNLSVTLGAASTISSSLSYTSGVFTYTPYNLPTASTSLLGGVKVDGTTITINGSGVISSTGGGGGALQGRSTAVVTTGVLAISGGTAVTGATVVAAKGYALYSIQVSAGAWVTVYTSTTAYNNDSARSITTDPTPGSGIIAEAITTSATTTSFTPAVFGYNADATVSSNMYLRITNNSGTSQAITVTITYLKLEA